MPEDDKTHPQLVYNRSQIYVSRTSQKRDFYHDVLPAFSLVWYERENAPMTTADLLNQLSPVMRVVKKWRNLPMSYLIAASTDNG